MIPFRQAKTAWEHGLLVQGLITRLDKLGVRLHPYYLIEECVGKDEPGICAAPDQAYTFGEIGAGDMEQIARLADRKWCPLETLLERLEQGCLCLGLKRGEDIAAFNWVNFEACDHVDNIIPMQESQAYLFDMYTLTPFRGMGLAPRLRCDTYRYLKQLGYAEFLSVSEYFNRPAIRFKLKLNARIVQLHLALSLFGKAQKFFVLRNYPS